MCRWAASYIAAKINAHTGADPFVLGLPTGSSPIGVYLELAKISMDQKDLAGDDYEIRCRFLNAVARSGAAEFIAPFKDRLGIEGGSPVKLIEAKPKEKKRVQHSTKTLGIYTTGEFKKQLDKLSNDMNTSTSALSRRILQTVVRKAGDTAEEKGISMKDALSNLLSSITVSKDENQST